MTRRKEEEKTTDNAKTTFQPIPMEVPILCPEATFPSQHQPVVYYGGTPTEFAV